LAFIESIEKIDTDLFTAINGSHSPFWDQVMYAVSGTFFWIPLYLLVIFLVIKKYKRSAVIPILLMIVGVIITDQLSVHLFKDVFERFRPCHNLELKDSVHLVNGKCGGQFGFVSSHAANTFMFALLSSMILKIRIYYFLIFFWAAFISYSRIYLGVHFPADIAVGALLGMIIALILFFLRMKLQKIKKE